MGSLNKAAITAFLLLFSTVTFGTQNVLFIHSYDTQHQWVEFINEGFNKGLSGKRDIHVFTEYMDVKRFPKNENREFFYQYLLEKYRLISLDAVVVSDDPALNLLRKHRDNSFLSVPLVYMGINKVSEEVLNIPNSSGVFENRNLEATMRDIKKTFKTDNLIVVSDSSSTGKVNRAKIQDALNKPGVPSQVHIISPLNASDISSIFNRYPPETPILIVGQIIDNKRNGSMMEWTNGIALLKSTIPNPLISIGIISLDHGAIAAHELDGQLHAIQAAELLLKVLDGKSAQNVVPITNAVSTWYFSWQAMKEYRLAKSALPDNSKVLFEDISFIEQNRNTLLVGSTVLLIASIIIVLLLALIRKGKQHQEILKENEIRYRDLALEGAHVFWESDPEDRIIYISGDTSNILNLSNKSMQDEKLSELMLRLTANNFSLSSYKNTVSKQQPLKNLVVKYTNSKDQQKIVSISGKARFSEQSEFIGYRGIIKEISEEFKLTQKILYEARHDSLTGLINRSTFNELCQEVVSTSDSSDTTSFICFLDLDRFKMVNDTIGHMAGDSMLAEVARAIKEQITIKDTLGRLGGDEFGLILKDKTARDALKICQQIIDSINDYRLYWNNSFYSVGASIGMVEVISSITFQELLSHADIACYKAKEQGRGRVYFSSDGDSSLVEEQMQLGYIANLNYALEQNQFFLAKQLIKPTSRSNTNLHYEVLLRYTNQHGDPVPPGAFIPAAEKYGVITLIDLWVIRTVISQYDTLFGDEAPTVSINISGVSLSSDEFAENVIKIIELAKFDVKKICFEITETSVISHIGSAIHFISELRKYGCKFALDDFGSGASSYGYLKQLPVDYIKIDGSLVTSIVSQEIDQTIVRSITEIAHSMNIKTVAEFVENDSILSVLQSIGVDYVQGYGIHKPENL